MASVALVAGGAYFLARGLALAQRRLLWRVRRKLIISYIFIGFIPAILIVAFFLLGGLLLFSNFSSYLVQTRLRALPTRRSPSPDDGAGDSAGRRSRRSAIVAGARRRRRRVPRRIDRGRPDGPRRARTLDARRGPPHAAETRQRRSWPARGRTSSRRGSARLDELRRVPGAARVRNLDEPHPTVDGALAVNGQPTVATSTWSRARSRCRKSGADVRGGRRSAR